MIAPIFLCLKLALQEQSGCVEVADVWTASGSEKVLFLVCSGGNVS